jgi:glyoxylase-like metal-dependent hydrolase (beta-lactamase superfamily II)
MEGPLITQVADAIYKIELPIPFPLQTVNLFFIDQPPRTLVDTGIKTEASFEALTEGLDKHGFRLESIERILITHGHIDHYGQAQKLSSLSGAAIFIHRLEYERICSLLLSLDALKVILLKNGVPQTLVEEAVDYIRSAQRLADPLENPLFLNDGDTIPFESMTWQVVHCPGHSPGLLCFYWSRKKLLFTGDHLLKEITPNPILSIPRDGPPYRYTSLKEYLASLEKIAKMDLSVLLTGHGDQVREPKGLIRNILAHHQMRMDQILSILSDGEKTPYKIVMDLFPGVPPFEVFLGISEVLGHLEILREKGRVGIKEQDGKDYYSME